MVWVLFPISGCLDNLKEERSEEPHVVPEDAASIKGRVSSSAQQLSGVRASFSALWRHLQVL